MTDQTAETAHVECTCPRTDGYRIKRRTCLAHAEQDAAHWAEHDRRKFGTDSPHKPTDEFVVQAFAEGARSLWPDSRDPGWHVTFRRWLEARDARVKAEALRTEAALIGRGTCCPECDGVAQMMLDRAEQFAPSDSSTPPGQ